MNASISPLRVAPIGLLLLLIQAAGSSSPAQTATWTGAGAESFGIVDGDTSVTATNGCNSEAITATFTTNGSPVTTPFANVSNDGQRVSVGMNLASAPGVGPSFELTFGGGLPVENLVFDIFDIDQVNNAGSAWTDRVTVTAFFGNTAVNINVACVDPDTVCSHSIVSTGGTSAILDGDFNNPVFSNINGVARTTIPGPVDRVVVRYEGTGPGSNTQFIGFSNFAFDCSLVPVTLTFLESRQREDSLEVSWTTATEIANVGFHVYGESRRGWRRLHERLIPSHQLDSLVPSTYGRTFVLEGGEEILRVALAEVDLRGREKLHGPFAAGAAHGAAIEPEPIDWSAIRRAALEGREARYGAAPHASFRGAVAGAELRVEQTGIHRITYEDLLASGVDLARAPVEALALTTGGRAVPRRVVSEQGGGFFGPGGYVEFVGEAWDSLFTRTNVYRLTVSARDALPVREFSVAPGPEWAESYREERRFEENRFYSFASPNGDPWYAERLLAYTSPISASFDLPVDELAQGDKVSLQIDLWGVTDWPSHHLDHHVEAYVNGRRVADRRFDGLVDASFEVDLPRGLLRDGPNELTLVLPGDTGADFDLIHVDSYGVRYSRRFAARQDALSFTAQGESFRVHGFSSPEVVAYGRVGQQVLWLGVVQTLAEGETYDASFGGFGQRGDTYWVAAAPALLKPEVRPLRQAASLFSEAADYLVISHPLFLPGLEDLVEARRRQGFQVKVVDVEDLYGHYTHGIFDPEAIRRYLADARARLGVRYVLLVGGDSYDYHDYLGVGSVSFLPTFYTALHPVVQFAPADSLLADVDGDEVPDLALGRWPVRSLQELQTLVDKTLGYAPASTPSAVFAAGQDDPPTSFAAVSEGWIGLLPENWSTTRAYVSRSGLPAAKAALLDQLEGGVSLVSYFGHSGPMAWTFENLFTAADASGLTNRESPFVALQWGCWNGYHSVPQYDTLSHELLLSPEGGAAAAFGASTLTEASSDATLGREVFERLAVPGTTLGMAILEAKRALAREGNTRDVLLGMTLLGDPALVLEP